MKTFQIAVIYFSLSHLIFTLNGFATEYKHTNQTCLDEHALYQRAKMLFSSGQYLMSALHFSQLSTTTCDPLLAHQSLFSYALAMSELGEFTEMMSTLSQIQKLDDPTLLHKSHLLQSYHHPELQNSLNSHEAIQLTLWNQRKSQNFSTLTELKTMTPNKQSHLISLQELILKSPEKTPWIAGVASTLLPGSGQAYVGNYQSAAVALILNSIFLATTVELTKHQLPFSAIASGLVFSVTYLGNIINAVDGAQKYNETSRRTPENEFRRSLFPEFTP